MEQPQEDGEAVSGQSNGRPLDGNLEEGMPAAPMEAWSIAVVAAAEPMEDAGAVDGWGDGQDDQQHCAGARAKPGRHKGRVPQLQVFQQLVSQSITERIALLTCRCGLQKEPCYFKLAKVFGGKDTPGFGDFVKLQTQINDPAQFNDPRRRESIFNAVYSARLALPDGLTFDSSRFILNGVFLCRSVFMGVTGLSERTILPIQQAVGVGHNTLDSVDKFKLPGATAELSVLGAMQEECREWQYSFADPENPFGVGYYDPVKTVQVKGLGQMCKVYIPRYTDKKSGFWLEYVAMRQNAGTSLHNLLQRRAFVKVWKMCNNHIFMTRDKGDHATCPDCAFWEDAFKKALLPDQQRYAAKGKSEHISFFRAQSNYYVMCCVQSERDDRWLTIGMDYPDAAKHPGIKFRKGSPGNIARTNDNYNSVPCIVSIAGVAVLGFVVPPSVLKDANTMVEIGRRSLIWSRHFGKLNSRTLGINWRIDSASDNLNATFLRFASLTSQIEGCPEVTVSCGVVSHTKNDVDRHGATVLAQRLKVDQRTLDDLDYVWRMGITPGVNPMHGHRTDARCDSKTKAVTDLFYVGATPDYCKAFSDDIDPSFGGHRAHEFRSVPGDAGFVPGQHCADKVHMFRFKSEGGSVRMTYKTDVRSSTFMPVLSQADGDLELTTDPAGLLWLKPDCDKKTWDDFEFDWAAQKKVDGSAILRYAQKVVSAVADETSFRGQCVSGVILRDTAPLILAEGTASPSRKSADGRFTLEQWERSDAQHEPTDFTRGNRMTAYPETFPRKTMLQWWRDFLIDTQVPLRSQAVQNSRKQVLYLPEVVSEISSGLAKCAPSFPPRDHEGSLLEDGGGSGGTSDQNAGRVSSYLHRPPAHENPTLTARNFSRADQKQVQSVLRRAQQEREGQCEECSTRIDVLTCGGIRYPKRVACCAHELRPQGRVIVAKEVGVSGLFTGADAGVLLRSQSTMAFPIRISGNACIDSEISDGTKYTVIGLTPPDPANPHLPIVATLQPELSSKTHRFQALSLASYWCVNCADPCHAVHFGDTHARPLHFTCVHCIEKEREQGFFTPKGVIAEFARTGLTGRKPNRFLLHFFGFELPEEKERQKLAFMGSINAQENLGFYTTQSIKAANWQEHLKAWQLRSHEFKAWDQRLSDLICVYDAEGCEWDNALVQTGVHRDTALVDLRFEGDLDSGQPDIEWNQNWNTVIWKDREEEEDGGQGPPSKARKTVVRGTASTSGKQAALVSSSGGGGGSSSSRSGRQLQSSQPDESSSSDDSSDDSDSSDELDLT
jgi:hypothetical protein